MDIKKNPRVRRDLEFFPIQNGNEPLIVIRDSLGLVEECKAVGLPLYEVMTLLDGRNTLRDIQMALMRQKGGILIGMDEVERLLAYLDESYLLESDRYVRAREKTVAEFTQMEVRPCSHCGGSYPVHASDLKNRLNEILNTRSSVAEPDGRVVAIIAPHIDLSAGAMVYASAYQWIKHTSPSTIVLLGVGHQMREGLFSLTDKDFQTPLGVVKNDRSMVQELRDVGRSIITGNDFVHKAEHSLEFQLIFLQHLLEEDSFSIIPILCDPIMTAPQEFTRSAYLDRATLFLKALSGMVCEGGGKTLVVAGVDFSHIGPKFGHDMPATHLEGQSERHDQKLLEAISKGEVDEFWDESRRVEDRFNVCGFSAMACLMEILPPSKGKVLNYQCWHEEATRSAVSFASVVFLEKPC